MIGIFVNHFNLFYPGSHPGSTVLLIFIEPVPTVIPNRILKTFETFLNSDFRSNAKENTKAQPRFLSTSWRISPALSPLYHVGTDPCWLHSPLGKCSTVGLMVVSLPFLLVMDGLASFDFRGLTVSVRGVILDWLKGGDRSWLIQKSGELDLHCAWCSP